MRIRVLAVATAVACAISPVPALAAEATTYYSTKQHYQPQGVTYAEAPAGFHQIYTSTVNRHGSRGLSSFKYDDLAQQMLEYAKEHGQLTELGEKLIPQVEAMITVNKELAGGTGQEAGYGNLTVVGREELQGIGQRNAQRNSALMDRIEDENLKVKYISSGEDRANDSGWNFGKSWLSANPQLSDNLVDGMEDGHVTIETRTDLMYAHKDKNAPSYEKYSEWKDSETLDSKVEEAYAKPASQTAARSLLNKIFTEDFIAGLEDGSISFVGREKDDKTVEGIVDAALQFYNLYIIAPALAHEEKTPAEGWIFDQYMDEASGPTFAYLLDVEDYYQKGPAIEGQTVAYDNFEPLLKEMIQGVKDRADGGDIAAEYRFGHAETIIPLAALLKLPGSEKGIPADELYSWENSDWRGDKVAPMGANIQWDAFQNEHGETLVRMLYNEKEIAFHDGCEPIAEGSTFYTIDELSECLPLGSTSDHSKARLKEDKNHDNPQPSPSGAVSSKAEVWGVVAAVIGALAIAVGTAAANAEQIKSILNKYGIHLPF
ncbi:histidine phosphatase family protein [Corynebacterium minutissimum]|uniref:histidine phosphatase family protein n=1 Tax=Corynebacterium minutissimum TaxID=38301 RepID=UPI001EF2F140|nr:histidine phosphatase family protein [Corynebacterium minutissimum]MCG7228923.1 histidine phosphatase family protein [Corynebacterium minutissimum]MCG7238040.1 histidine phosphatase family protein [Corynebacterium minutissimum]